MKKLYVLGDSISIHYGPYLEQYLEGCFEYDRKGKKAFVSDLNVMSAANGGDSGNCLSFLTEAGDIKCDIFLLNCGLHDIKTTDVRQVSLETYESNLRKIVSIMQERKTNLVWITSTPVADEIHNARSKSFKRYNKDLLLYNETAKSVMSENGIPIIDLYAFTERLGGDEIYEDHVHFTPSVRRLQAAYIAGYLSTTVSNSH